MASDDYDACHPSHLPLVNTMAASLTVHPETVAFEDANEVAKGHVCVPPVPDQAEHFLPLWVAPTPVEVKPVAHIVDKTRLVASIKLATDLFIFIAG